MQGHPTAAPTAGLSILLLPLLGLLLLPLLGLLLLPLLGLLLLLRLGLLLLPLLGLLLLLRLGLLLLADKRRPPLLERMRTKKCQQIAALVMLQRRREPNRYCWQQAQHEAMDNYE
jgi:phosphoglycerol transferase MdoB-like AlkP superfamily enzyme